MSEEKRYDELSSLEAERIERDCVCAQCWGVLTTLRADIHKRTFKVVCPKCGEDRGFVTREYAEKRKIENRVEAVEAEMNIGKLLNLSKKDFNRDQTINDLYR